jgi:hypothetical protein
MKRSAFSRYALTNCVAAAMLAGCGESQPPIGAPGAIPQISANATHAERGKSWMKPEARTDKLLYVSDNTKSVVYVISYPQGELVGTLTGFYSPVGLCTDQKGNVWIVNQSPDEVIEYSHAGTRAKRTLKIHGGFSFGCAVYAKSGDIAVTVGAFSVAIFKHGKGHPTIYNDHDLDYIGYCGYDDRGDLFCGGENGYDAPLLAELPAGGTTLETIALNFSMHGSPGAVHWNGRRLVIAEQPNFETNALPVYQVKVVGSTGRLAATTELDGDDFCCGSQGWLHHRRYIATDNLGQGLAIWSFPKGGEPLKVISIPGAGDLWGCVVSL